METRQFQQIETDSQQNLIIGMRKYEWLKSFSPEELTDFQKKQIENFENKQSIQTPEQREKTNKYWAEILAKEEKKEFSISAKKLYELFVSNFEKMNNKAFERIDGITIENLKPLIYYFSKDKRFFDCQNLKSNLSVPSFEKGLLVIGNFGNGKTTTMKVFEQIFKGIAGIGFKGYSANEVVTMFENCKGDASDILRNEFNKKMFFGTRYFDDLKTERIASNFGKVNIFKEILEERYDKKAKTFVTCNFKDGYPNCLKSAIDEFEEKYGGRVYDRLFEMFNIVEFKGKSFRK